MPLNLMKRMTGGKENIHLQSESARIRTINIFCAVTAILATPYVFFLLYLRDYLSTGVMAVIICLFLSCILLNKNGRTGIARLLILADTNFAVLYFSSLFGFESGIHLYLFTSPLIVYLLYNFRQTANITLAFSTYLFTFIAVFLLDKTHHFYHPLPASAMLSVLYGVNFCFALLLAFLLIVYFATNNAAYNQILEKQNDFLQTHEEALMKQISERITAEEKLQKSLHEKNILLSEVHHRVKNNLALISGLLELQSMYTEDVQVQALFSESRTRIKSLAALHESLYQTENISSIRFDLYFERIFAEVSKTYPAIAGQIELRTSIEPIELDMSQAIPSGLLVNEIISNAYKYAFIGRDRGQILVTASKEKGSIKLLVKDDGCGLPPETETSKKTFGMTLINAFVQQLNGHLETSNDKGACFRITFPHKRMNSHAE